MSTTLRPVTGLVAVAVFVLVSSGLAAAVPGFAPHPAGPAAKSSGGCPSSNAVSNFLASGLVGASVGVSGSTWTLSFSSFANLSPTSGVPGLIEYCVYPSGSLPSTSTASAVGADGSSFVALSGTHQGYFGFGRSSGDPSNLPLDGAQNVRIGNATWTSSVPSNATLLLHINDAAECQFLYGGGSTTCFVLPSPPPTSQCGGNPSCKVAVVAEALAGHPNEVPSNTQLHVTYTYTIANAFTNSFNMTIAVPGSTAANFTGVRDYFNCSQTPDPSGTPGAVGLYSSFQGTGLTVRLHYLSEHGVCPNLVLTAWANGSAIVLHPGQSLSWTIQTITGPSGFSGRGWHCLNEGVQFVWLQSNDNLVHRYTSPDVDVWTAS